jgi:Cytosolic carboxypeptidase N-terminal domain
MHLICNQRICGLGRGFIFRQRQCRRLHHRRCEQHTVNLTLRTETLNNTSDTYTYWTNFKLLGALNRTVAFHITNASMVRFLKSTTNEAQLVYSFDGENWNRLAHHSYSGETYTFSETFTCDEPQIATFFPYP